MALQLSCRVALPEATGESLRLRRTSPATKEQVRNNLTVLHLGPQGRPWLTVSGGVGPGRGADLFRAQANA